MVRHYFFNHVVHLLSPRQWLVVGLLSGLLAFGSGLYLAVLAGMPLSGPLARMFDATELFIRDTIRLTFKDRSEKRVMVGEHAVFMAPLGILEPDRTFKWLDVSTTASTPTMASGPVAPTVVEAPNVVAAVSAASNPPAQASVGQSSRMLDPDWKPDFKGD